MKIIQRDIFRSHIYTCICRSILNSPSPFKNKVLLYFTMTDYERRLKRVKKKKGCLKLRRAILKCNRNKST